MRRRPLMIAAALLGATATYVALSPRHPGPLAREARVHPSAMTAPQTSGLPLAAPADPAADAAAFHHFDAWLERWNRADPAVRREIEGDGVTWAAVRRGALKDLMRTDPAAALSRAIPFAARAGLPSSVQSLLEEPIAAAARFEVAVACGFGEEGHRDTRERFTTIGARRLETYTCGRRLDVTTKHLMSVNGIALDDVLALAESPVRVLPAEERLARGFGASGVVVEAWGELRVMADTTAVADYAAALVAAEDAVDPDAKPPRSGGDNTPTPLSTYTEGTKTLLYIVADYPDVTGFPQTVSTISNAMNGVTQYWDEVSYAKARLDPTYVPSVVRLPQACSYYTNRFSQLLTDAKAAALAAGYDAANYDFYVVLTDEGAGSNNFSYAGKAWVGSPGCHLVDPYYTLRTAGHEIGHNFGLQHANSWRSDADTPIGRDSLAGGYVTNTSDAEWTEYGHRFSVMSGQSTADMSDRKAHFGPREKLRLEWIRTNEVVVLTNSAVVRLYRFDHRDATGLPRAIHINRPTADYTSNGRMYWLGYRRAYPDNGWLQEGVQVDWVRATYGSDGAIGLDMTPFSNDSGPGSGYTFDNNDKWDGALLIGRTYSDPTNSIHITPTARGGAGTNEWIDVTVNIGSFPTNLPPTLSLAASTLAPTAGQLVTLTATASDPNGDALAYEWDFGVPKSLFSNSLNRARVTNSWSAASEYVVRCVASDMRGGRASTSLVLTVGNPGTVYRITGRVISNGLGVAGARVYTSHTNMTYTISDGSYSLVDLPAANYTVLAQKHTSTLSPVFNNPLTVGPTTGGRDFGAEGPPAVRWTPGGPVSVSEGGPATSLVLSLASRPTNTVTLTLVRDTNQVALSTSSVTITATEWLHGRTVSVAAVDDVLQETPTHTSLVTQTSASSDTSYNGIAVPALVLRIAENDFNQPPGIAVTNPPAPQEIAEGQIISLAASAQDADGTITQSACYVDATLLAASGGAEVSAAWTAAVTGAHQVWARAWDQQGASATSLPVTVTVLADLDRDGTPDADDPDDDGDGLSDEFEIRYFGGGTNGQPGADADGDGFANLSEFWADTDPTNAASYLFAGSILAATGGQVTFLSSTGRLYTLQYCTDLMDGNTWSNISDQVDVPGAGGSQSLGEPMLADRRWYRIIVRPPP